MSHAIGTPKVGTDVAERSRDLVAFNLDTGREMRKSLLGSLESDCLV
jgi:hypothetical protein